MTRILVVLALVFGAVGAYSCTSSPAHAAPAVGDVEGGGGSLDAGVPSGAARTGPSLPDPSKDTTGWLTDVEHATQAHDWRLLAGLVLVLLVAGLRKFGTDAVPWFGTHWGGVGLACFCGMLLAAGSAAASGQPWSLATVLGSVVGGLETALMGSGIFSWHPGTSKAAAAAG